MLIVVTGYLYVMIPKGFFPEQDTGFIFGQADAREDISFEAMARLTHQIVDIVRQDPYRFRRLFVYRGQRLQPDREHGPCVHPAGTA